MRLRHALRGWFAALLLANHTPLDVPGERFSPDYALALGPFQGDWNDAAQIYKAWANQQPWMPPPLATRFDLPDWWKAAQPVISGPSYGDDGQAILPAPQMPDLAQDYAAYLGGPVTLLTFGWEKHGAWTGPDYFPPRDGAQAFRDATEALHAEGNRKYVYVSGTVWRLTRKELPDYDDTARFEQTGRRYAALGPDASPFLDPFYESIGWQAVRMCPATDYWQGAVVDSVVSAAKLGIDAVSVDEFPIGSNYACHSTTHGHPSGAGAWQAAAYRSILERARRQGRAANPALALTCEEPSELYLDLLDGHVSRENRPDWFLFADPLRRFGERYELIPLFSAVYHEHTLAVAEPTPLELPGASRADMERLRTSFARGIANGLVQGKIPSAGVAAISQVDPQLLDLFRRVVQATGGYAHQYVILGEMLRPPSLDVPHVTVDWLDVDLTSGETQMRQTSSPAVLAGAWRAPSGHVGFSLANITNQQQAFDLPVSAAGLAGPYLVYAVRDGGYEIMVEGDTLPSAIEIALAPWGTGLVAIVPATSREAAIARTEPASTPTPSPIPRPARGAGLCGGAQLALAAGCSTVWFPRWRRKRLALRGAS